MINTLKVNGHTAIIQYDPDIEMFRGEFTFEHGAADFYAKDINGLKKEGAISLKVYLDYCKEKGIKPNKQYSGKFNVRIPPELHEKAVIAASATGVSLNQLITDALQDSVG